MATMPSDLECYIDENDPTEPGDIKVVRGGIDVIDACDAVTDWAISGTGCTVDVGTSFVEGAGSLLIYVPTSTTGVLTFTHATTVDLSTDNWLRFWLLRDTSSAWISYSTNITFHAHFGEAVATEQTMGNFTLTSGDVWVEKAWDISAIAAADKNAVKYFVLNVQNNSATKAARVLLDYVYGDPGPASVRAYDGTRVINIYPKMLTGTWEGTGADKVVTLDRKGTPSFIRVIDLDTPSVPLIWMNGMGTNSMRETGAADYTGANAGIYAVGDGTFTVEAAYTPNGMTMLYMVMWDD